MPESMTRRLQQIGCWWATAMLLSACAGSSPIRKPDLSRRDVYPVDMAALGLGNLISFDVYVDTHSVHALFAAERQGRKSPYIGYVNSVDGGVHWSAPLEIGHELSAGLESRFGNDVQIAASGDQRVALWQVRGELPGMGPLVVLSSQDGGQVWTQGENPVTSDFDQSHADLAADSQGRLHLVWLDDRDENGYQGLRYARSLDAGLHWEQQQTIDESSCSCCWNRLVISSDDRLKVLYRDMEPRDMALAQSSDSGLSWQRTATVGEFNWHFNGCPHNGGALAYVDDQVWHSLVWTGADNKVGLYHLQSANAGRDWSLPQSVGDGTKAFHSDVAVDKSGNVAAIWDELGVEGSRVVFSQSFDWGEKGAVSQTLSAEDGSATFPRLVVTDAGLLAMWMEQKTGSQKQWRVVLLQ